MLRSGALPLFQPGQYDERMSFGETIFLFVLALVVFGPKKLPEIARQVGKYLNEFKRASNEFKAQIEQEISHIEVQERQKSLASSPPPEGTTSRSLKPGATGDGTGEASAGTPVEVAPIEAAEPPAASLAGSPAVSEVNSVESTIPATEAIPASEPETSPASQESHA
jgi:sec-independent protein translocase protein TatB